MKKTIFAGLGAIFLTVLAYRALTWYLIRHLAEARSRQPPHSVSPSQYFNEEIFLPFFIKDARRPGFLRAWRLEDPPVYSISIKKSTDTFRVFVIGGSIAANYRYAQPRASLETALQQLLPSKKIEVINCGMRGYDSYRELMLLRELLKFSPDLLVLMSGHNEKGDATKPIPLAKLYVLDRLNESPAFLRLRAFLAARQAAATKGRVREDEEEALINGVFSKNLGVMIKLAKSHGVPIALCSPPINYRDAVPFRPIPIFDKRFMPGWISYLRGNCAIAARSWLESLPRFNRHRDGDLHGLTLFYLGRCAEETGSWGRARDFYIRSKDISHEWAYPQRLGLIEEMARKNDAVWIDLDGAFQAEVFPRIPGLDLFVDGCHWRDGVDAFVSLEIVRAIRKSTQLRHLSWDEKGLTFLSNQWKNMKFSVPARQDMALTYIALRDMDRPIADLSWRAVLALEYLSQRQTFSGSQFFEAIQLAKRKMDPLAIVWERPPWKVLEPRFLWHFGEALLRRRKYRPALAEFSKALELEPTLHEALLSEAVGCGLAGDKAEAHRILEKAARRGLGKESAIVTTALGLNAGKQRVAEGQPKRVLAGGAGEAAEKARRDDLRLREMASKFLSLKRYDKAISLLNLLAQRHPNDIDGWLDLAHAGGQAGDREAARKALARAQPLKPGAAQRRRMLLVYQDIEEYRRSRDIIDDLIRSFPEAAGYYRDRGIINYRMGDKASAIDDFQKALKIQPGLLSASSSLAALYIEQGRLREALEAYDKALNAQPPSDEKDLAAVMDRERRELRARMEKEKR